MASWIRLSLRVWLPDLGQRSEITNQKNANEIDVRQLRVHQVWELVQV